MYLFELAAKGGVVMNIILLLSVYVSAVILFKLYQFWRFKVMNFKFVDEIYVSLEDNQILDALRIANNSKNPVARVIELAIKLVKDNNTTDGKKLRKIDSIGSKQIRMLDSHLKGLELVATIAPLLGLLGTVIGMVKAFSGIEQVGARVDPSILAGGIWEALLTTVVGLIVAIPALSAYYIIDAKVEKVRLVLKESISNIMAN